MKLCILDNDILEGQLAQAYTSFGAMFIRLFENAWVPPGPWRCSTPSWGQYPASFDDFDAVLLTGSRADSFSDEPWVVELRRRVTALLQERKKMVGVCFGHQLIALCMGAPVGRAPQGWGAGRLTYDWHRQDLPYSADRTQIALLASHQDQVHELPPGATLVASSDFCPVAAFTVGKRCFASRPTRNLMKALAPICWTNVKTRWGKTTTSAAGTVCNTAMKAITSPVWSSPFWKTQQSKLSLAPVE
jgi:GMP synthase-like glutamine amidotransferase